MAMQGNLNDRVWVQLTPQGREMYATWEAGYREKYAVPLPPDWSGPLEEEPRFGEGFVGCQLYELMCIFGPFLGITSRMDMQPFKGNTIYYSSPW